MTSQKYMSKRVQLPKLNVVQSPNAKHQSNAPYELFSTNKKHHLREDHYEERGNSKSRSTQNLQLSYDLSYYDNTKSVHIIKKPTALKNNVSPKVQTVRKVVNPIKPRQPDVQNMKTSKRKLQAIFNFEQEGVGPSIHEADHSTDITQTSDSSFLNERVMKSFNDCNNPSKPGKCPMAKACIGSYHRTATYAKELARLRLMNEDERIEFLAKNIVGRNLVIETIYGKKLKLYADYTASGQELKFLVDEMLKIEELYANTHTETSYTGAYMNKMLEQAESQILRECKASEKHYFFVGAGSGSTAAIEMVQKVLGTYIPPQTIKLLMQGLDGMADLSTFDDIKAILRAKNVLPLVICSHYEHHSNEITWRDQLCDVMEAPCGMDGLVDLSGLETMLKKQPKGRKLIGSFSAGSNVSGIKSDVFGLAKTMKKYGGLCFFDYGAVGPYLPIDLSQILKDGRTLIDGVYISPHKFLGGPGTCGVLIMSKQCYDLNLNPTHGGGGTVEFVCKDSKNHSENYNHREKSGTPGIYQIIKCGLVFELKGIMQETIHKKEVLYCKKFFDRMRKKKNFLHQGPMDEDQKVSIISFNIWHQTEQGKRWLHPQFVIKLLNDLFGIQGRAGCMCAGPYFFHYYNLSEEVEKGTQFWSVKHPEMGDDLQVAGIKTGVARINLHYSLKEYEVEYIIFALEFLCDHGYKFLPQYIWEPLSGSWYHKDVQEKKPTFGVCDIINEEREYCIDEKSRRIFFEKHKMDALEKVKILDQSQRDIEYDTMPEMRNCCLNFVVKGNVLNREKIVRKGKFFDKFLESQK